MSDGGFWLSQRAVSAFVLGALAGGTIVLITTLAHTQNPRRKRFEFATKKRNLYASPKRDISLSQALEDEILSEQFTRNVQFFGADGQLNILNAFVVVVGLGGVGSHAAHMLLRAGVGRLRLVDFDQVSLSSLNRHAVATRADVGLSKAAVLKRHFQEMVPEACVEAEVAMFTTESQTRLLKGRPDYVIDAIDDIDTKARYGIDADLTLQIALLAACKAQNLPVICVCGAGAKADPSRVRITDLSEASLDPLARKVRYQLRVKHGIRSGIPMVLSSEKPRCSLLPVSELTHDPFELQVIPNFRIRTVPVLGTTPAIFGMAAASWILCRLAGQPYIPEPMFIVKAPEFTTLVDRLVEREELNFGNARGIDLDVDDITFLARDVWRAKSAFANPGDTSVEKGLMRTVSNLHFTRWEPSAGPAPDNFILLTSDEADLHDREGPDELKAQNPELYKHIMDTLSVVRMAFGGKAKL